MGRLKMRPAAASLTGKSPGTVAQALKSLLQVQGLGVINGGGHAGLLKPGQDNGPGPALNRVLGKDRGAVRDDMGHLELRP